MWELKTADVQNAANERNVTVGTLSINWLWVIFAIHIQYFHIDSGYVLIAMKAIANIYPIIVIVTCVILYYTIDCLRIYGIEYQSGICLGIVI